MIREEIKGLLHKAIDLAQGFSSCAYTRRDNTTGALCAWCVFAQFAVLRGVPVEAMCGWGTTNAIGVRDLNVPHLHDLSTEEWDLMYAIQTVWDGWRHSDLVRQDECTARKIMHELVDNDGKLREEAA